jgi:hypoxanthine phosphoribosyltransferase
MPTILRHTHPVRYVAIEAAKEYFRPLTLLYDLIISDINGETRSIRSLAKENKALKQQAVNLQNLSVPSYSLLMDNIQAAEHHDQPAAGKKASYNPALESPVLGLSRTLMPLRLPKRFTQMCMASSEIGIAKIELVITKIKEVEQTEPVLFGVNKSGDFLASYIANRLNFHQKNLSRCHIKDNNEIICQSRKIPSSKPIIIIDGISRTGKSLSLVKNFLHEKYAQSKIYTMVLVAVEHEPSIAIAYIDYAAWTSTNPTLKLPWSSEPETTIGNFKINGDEVSQLRESYRLTTDYEG